MTTHESSDVFPGVMTSCQDLIRHDVHLRKLYELILQSERNLGRWLNAKEEHTKKGCFHVIVYQRTCHFILTSQAHEQQFIVVGMAIYPCVQITGLEIVI